MPTTTHTTDDRPTTRKRRWATAALLLLALLGLLAASLSAGRPTGASPDPDRASAGAGDTDKALSGDDAEAALDADEEPNQADVDLDDGGPDPGDPAEAGFDDGGASADRCGANDPADGSLLVTPHALVLPSGEMDSELHVRNCGADDVAWSAATKPSVTLATAAGTLDPGEVFPIELTIDSDQWGPGAIEFKVRVTEGAFAFNTYVDVRAFRPLVGADVVATNEISAGPGEGGCSLQCITRAQLSTGYSSPDVGLDVGTTVPAKVRVYLSTNPPVIDQDGNPKFPGKPPKATSPDGVQSWKTTLANLQPTTKYFIIVEATDADDDTAYRHGSFTTITPVQQGGGLATAGPEPGCSAGCITKASVTPGDGSAPAKVVVRTHTPATFELMLSTEPPTTVDGHPHFDKKPVWHASGLDYIEAWDHQVSGLQPATTYHGIVVARDANGHRSYATGKFTTDGIDVVITVHNVRVVGDGDKGGKNRGELTFTWGVGESGSVAGFRGEERIHSGRDVQFGRSSSAYVVYDAQGVLPLVRAVAFERDPDGKVEFCAAGDGGKTEPGASGGCDTKWTVATSSEVRAGDLDRLPGCAAMGVTEEWVDGCLRIESGHHGDDYPAFYVVVSYSYVD